MSTRAVVFAVGVVGLVVGMSGTAFGEEEGGEAEKKEVREDVKVEKKGEVGKEDRQKAQKLFKEGYEAYQRQEYSTAVSLWRKAYEYVPEAVFLFNAARAAEKLGNLETARKLAEQAKEHKERGLSAADTAKNEQLLQRVRAKKEYRKEKQEWSEAKKLDWRGVSGLVAVGVGAGAMVTAGFVGRRAQEINNDLADARTRPEYRNLTDDFQAQQNLGRGLLYSGIGVAATGIGFAIWDLADVPEKPSKPEFSLGMSRGGGVQGVFRVSF